MKYYRIKSSRSVITFMAHNGCGRPDKYHMFHNTDIIKVRPDGTGEYLFAYDAGGKQWHRMHDDFKELSKERVDMWLQPIIEVSLNKGFNGGKRTIKELTRGQVFLEVL